MKASVENVNPVQLRVKVELSEEDVNNAFSSAYQRLRKKASIRGFRKGKAPLSVLRKFYGPNVAVEVADDLVRNHLFSAIQENKLEPVAAPVLETADLPQEGQIYTFSAIVDIMPAIEVDHYKGLAATVPSYAVSDGMAAKKLEQLQRQHAKTKELEAEMPAKQGHVATITQTATVDGEPFSHLEAENGQIEIGQAAVLEETESALVGMKAGDSKSYEVTLSKDFADPKYAEKTAVCQITLNKIEELLLPNLDDEFAKDLGMETVEQLKTRISESLHQQASQKKRQHLESDLMKQLSEKHDFEVPPSIVDRVIDNMVDERVKDEGEKAKAKKDQSVRDSLRTEAKSQAKNTLILSGIIKKENIEVADSDVDAYLESILGGQMDPEKRTETLAQLKKSLPAHITENLQFQKAIEFIIANANVAEITD